MTHSTIDNVVYYNTHQNKVQSTSTAKKRKEGAEHITRMITDMKGLLQVMHMKNVKHKIYITESSNI